MENSPTLILGKRKIGKNYKPLVIAEIGINHNGDIDTALAMVDAAYKAGAEVIKHQTHIPEDEMSQAARQVIPGNANISIYEIIESCALNEADEWKLKDYVEAKGMIFLSTPFSRAAANRLEKMGVIAYKIGSGECNNYPLLEHIAGFGKPIILSTGMNNLASVKHAVSIFQKHKIPYALLHTTNLYPTPAHLVRLGAMQELMQSFPEAVVGLSDHTINNRACFAAVALGASILERHFTDSMNRVGPDIINSMDPTALQELISGSEEIYKMRGGHKESSLEEQVTIDFAFATVVSIQDIQADELLSMDNIWVKRPGKGGVHAADFEKILGKRARKFIPCDHHLDWNDFY